MPLGIEARPGSMGVPLPGIRVDVDGGELVIDPASDPTFFLRYLGEEGDRQASGEVWRTGDRVARDEQGFLHFEGRSDDVIISAGYRIGPFEVESACIEHAAVREAAAVASPDERRGAIVKAFIVLAEGFEPSDELGAEISEFVRTRLSQYAYPRKVEFVADLPKTLTGKIRRIELREREQQAAAR